MNKNNMKHIYKISTIALMTGILGVYMNCEIVPETAKIEAQDSSSAKAPAPKPVPTTQGEILQALEVSSGVKSYEEILETYSSLTGIPSNNGNIRNIYENEVKVSLPTNSEMKSYLSGHQVALSKLAAEYCNEMINNTTLRQQIWTDAKYGQVPATAFSVAGKDELSQKTMDLFWGPSADAQEKAEMKVVLNDLIDDLIVGETANAATTVRVAKGICTAALASMHVTAK